MALVPGLEEGAGIGVWLPDLASILAFLLPFWRPGPV